MPRCPGRPALGRFRFSVFGFPLCGVCRHSCGFSLCIGGRLERPIFIPPLLVCLRPFAAGSSRWRTAALKQTRTIGPHPAGFRPAKWGGHRSWDFVSSQPCSRIALFRRFRLLSLRAVHCSDLLPVGEAMFLNLAADRAGVVSLLFDTGAWRFGRVILHCLNTRTIRLPGHCSRTSRTVTIAGNACTAHIRHGQLLP